MHLSVDPLPATAENVPREVNTLVVGAGQAGLATSYWLSHAGVEHQLLERRATLGGAWQDRWDAFCLNTPNFSLTLQLHTNDYRNPGQLPDGAVLIVGTGQSGGQIAEELLAAGREIHLAVSNCPEAPRRYRGQDVIYWLMQLGRHGPEYGLNGLTVEQLPSPAARFACNPLVSGADGGHDIHLRDLGRRGVRLHGHLDAADDGELVFSDDLPERLGRVEAGFSQRLQPMIDSYIAAAGIQAPAAEPARREDWLPSAPARLNLAAENITSVIWATGYGLDFSILQIPVLDEWNYPRHLRGVTAHPGLYAVGLPWLTGHGSSIVAGVGRDAAYIAEHIAGR